MSFNLLLGAVSEPHTWKKSRTPELICFKDEPEQVTKEFKDPAPGPQREGGLRPLALGCPESAASLVAGGLGSRGLGSRGLA